MIRQLVRGAALLVLILMVLDSTGRSQPVSPDKIFYKDKNGVLLNKEGELKSTPGGVQVTGAGKVLATISPNDIVHVVPGELQGLERIRDILGGQNLEDKKEFEKARAFYTEVKKKISNPAEKTRRFLEFKIAMMTAKAADESTDDNTWKTREEDALNLLTQYLIANPNGWETWPAGKVRTRIQTELGKHSEAATTWTNLAKSADVPADLKQEASLQAIEADIRAKRMTDATDRIAKLKAGKLPGPLNDRLTIYEQTVAALNGTPLSGIPIIEAEIAKKTAPKVKADPAFLATAFAMLGELNLAGNQLRDAMWAYYWVVVVYNQDKDEVLKAMTRLTEVFDKLGDADRAKAHKESLHRFRIGL